MLHSRRLGTLPHFRLCINKAVSTGKIFKINPQSAARFHKMSSAILNRVFQSRMKNEIINCQDCFIQVKMGNCLVSMVPAGTGSSISKVMTKFACVPYTLEWYSVTNHRRLDGLLNRLFRRRAKKISKIRVTGPCVGNSPVASEFPAQRASNAEDVFHLMTSSCNSYFLCCYFLLSPDTSQRWLSRPPDVWVGTASTSTDVITTFSGTQTGVHDWRIFPGETCENWY